MKYRKTNQVYNRNLASFAIHEHYVLLKGFISYDVLVKFHCRTMAWQDGRFTHVEEGPLITEILFIRNKRHINHQRYLKEVSLLTMQKHLNYDLEDLYRGPVV
jgi:hypothetical protein